MSSSPETAAPEPVWHSKSETLLFEGEPALEYELTWPEYPASGLTARWLNRLYQRMARCWEHYWTARLYPRACQELAQKRAASRPFRPWAGGVTGEETTRTDTLLRLRFEGWERRGDGCVTRISWEDGWDLTPYSLPEKFLKKSKKRG